MGNGLDSLLRPQLNHVRKNRAFYERVTAANLYHREQLIAREAERMVQQEIGWYPSGGVQWQPWTQTVRNEQDPQVVLDWLFGTEVNHVHYNRASYESATVANYFPQQQTAREPVRIVQQEERRNPSGGIQWQPRTRTQIVRNDEQDPQVVRRAQNHYTSLITLVLCCPEAENWAPADYTLRPMYLVLVSNTSREYESVSQLFKSTNQKCYCITKIERIQNPYLLCAFLLKKEELKTRLGYTPEERDLFHGTKCSSVPSICMNNFDWRRHGEHVGAKFGKGVSFSPISNYATHYSDEGKEGKVMLLVKVLIGKTCVGQKDMALPPGDFDTTGKENGEVIVKYEDNEFYPAYKITYDFTGNFDPNKNRGRRQKKVNLNCDNYYVDYGY